MKNKNASAARKLASQQAGQVTFAKKLAEGIWFYKTEGGNCIVTDTDIRPDTCPWKHDVYASAKSTRCYTDEQHFACFIGEWTAIPEYMYGDEFINNAYRRLVDTSYDEWANEYKKDVIDKVAKLHPATLNDRDAVDKVA